MKFKAVVSVLLGVLALSTHAKKPSLSEISVDLKMDERDYVSGERVRAVVDVKNLSPKTVSVGYPDSKDTVLVEIFRSNDHIQIDRVGRMRPFVSAFSVKSNEGQLLETFLGDHYDLEEPRSYLARAVLVHNGYRYEGPYRAFSVVPGNYITSAKQMFANREGVSRRFELVRWARNGVEHAFLSAYDEYEDGRKQSLGTTDIGAMLRITKPTLSILPGGEVIVIHRNGADSFVRSEFWSMPKALVLRSRMSVGDPATAGQARIQELYKREGGIKPVDRPWWKFW